MAPCASLTIVVQVLQRRVSQAFSLAMLIMYCVEYEREIMKYNPEPDAEGEEDEQWCIEQPEELRVHSN